jgi:histidine triad (HIT) family protein
MGDCIFCKIIEGKVSAKKVYEDELTVAFWDARPAAPIHILIVPREHVATLNDIADDDVILGHMGRVAKEIAQQMGVADFGYRFFVNVNRGGGQVVFHLHAHLISGNDLGSVFLKVAVFAAVLWRKVVSAFKPVG